ncbi:MAG: UDP-N-acetylglucosamine--N-acetylmuramyl-(pentapeptide) pyrophosphoryl-undecaprenol [Bacteroidota bacterium]|jgi:uncharacterized protein (TIGR00661 family)
METRAKNILVAPLNWGLGHATRCIPIIRELQKHQFTVILASDGASLHLLQKEFPTLLALELPSYAIEYAQNEDDLKWKLLKNSPKMLAAVRAEKKLVKQWVTTYALVGILSDNRLGVYNKKIPSVIITHQLNVLSGNTTWISSKLHQYYIKKFTECWVPDMEEKPNMTGKMGHLTTQTLSLRYIGPLSRFEKKESTVRYELMVILSGPEPQRTMLEALLRTELQRFKGRVLFISGVVEAVQKTGQDQHITYYNFMTSLELEQAFNESALVLCRSGYTTIMDLSVLQKNVFFIPTPGQFEQEYLAKRIRESGFAPYAKQANFKIEHLLEVGLFKGLPQLRHEVNWAELFELFQGKREF